jgi:ACT domain-containing protein
MEKVINQVKQDDQDEQYMLFWLSKTPSERIQEVTRLRYNYYKWKDKIFPVQIEKVIQKRPL